jgi:urease alpha subunit
VVAGLLRREARHDHQGRRDRGRAHGRSQRLDPDAAAGALPPDVRRLRQGALEEGLTARLNVERALVAVENTRDIGKKDMIHNSATPEIEVDPETYEVRADGELLTCQPAKVLPMAQRYFLF